MMINIKSFAIKAALILPFIATLSSCYMYEENPQMVDYSPQSPMNTQPLDHNKPNPVPVAKAKPYASKEPTQEATPGPKRAAAPQLPVIQ